MVAPTEKIDLKKGPKKRTNAERGGTTMKGKKSDRPTVTKNTFPKAAKVDRIKIYLKLAPLYNKKCI